MLELKDYQSFDDAIKEFSEDDIIKDVYGGMITQVECDYDVYFKNIINMYKLEGTLFKIESNKCYMIGFITL